MQTVIVELPFKETFFLLCPVKAFVGDMGATVKVMRIIRLLLLLLRPPPETAETGEVRRKRGVIGSSSSSLSPSPQIARGKQAEVEAEGSTLPRMAFLPSAIPSYTDKLFFLLV